ncbi:hypothetical protein ACWCQL_38565 [Streptomyces sp. NPDC002073]|uniref:hypothetical protein n=1 Tax=Streptomyces sp. NBC_00239 TaxID=2903640 RepID=UPI002E2AE26A|nr:hypothetical protein [Streptomyces sp. NBC_00239]
MADQTHHTHGAHETPEPADAPEPQAGRVEFTCPACGRPVETVIKRHKTLGAFVPQWRPGPCRHPDCPEYVPG